jgi:aryl-alcohol dehydrogenase-like predicted oxidoreductase
MVQRRLGNTGFAVAPIGLGSTKFGRNSNVKYPLPFALPSEKEVQAVLAAALDVGVNLIDTAPAYGDSERRIGAAIAGQRDHWVLCTKCGERYHDDRSTYDFSAQALNESLEGSLRRLKTDHVDILLLHSDGHDLDILTQSDAVETMTRFKASGKTRTIGISAKTADGIIAAIPRLDVIMAPFNQKETALAGALASAREAGLGILAIKGLFSGYLEADAAIAFVLRQSFVDGLILGTINPAHLRQAVAIANSL